MTSPTTAEQIAILTERLNRLENQLDAAFTELRADIAFFIDRQNQIHTYQKKRPTSWPTSWLSA